MDNLVYVGLLAQVKYPVLPVSLDGHSEVVAAGSKVRHLETISKGPLYPFYLCNARADDQ